MSKSPNSGRVTRHQPETSPGELYQRIAELEERLRAIEAQQRGGSDENPTESATPEPPRDHDVSLLVQNLTDQATRLIAAEAGAFFYNAIDGSGESYMLHALSGVSPEAFENFPMPRNTEVFGPTFRGEGIVRSDDITKDVRYGKNPPHGGMPVGHLPIKSYLAVPVISNSEEVLGGLFLGHSAPERFTLRHEVLIAGLAAQAATAIDHARLFEKAHWAQEELKRANEDLRRANRDLETFSYSASHDLQEPLRTIAINVQLLQRSIGQTLDADSMRLLQFVLDGTHRMETLVKDLMTYNNAIQHAEGVTPKISATVVLDRVLLNLANQMEECGAAVSAEDLPSVYLHEVHLAQIFQNLIGNALKYGRADAPPRVHISAQVDDPWCVFVVADNGIGIEAEYSERIFELFKRLHTHEEYSGTGVGLAICRRIVEQYGGRIWLEKSVPGQGSTFRFAVPIIRTLPELR